MSSVRSGSRSISWIAVVALTLPAPAALALRIENGNNPIQLDFTEDAALDYHFAHGNGNIEPRILNGVSNPNWDPTSDNYFDWINRFETQFSMGAWHADLRFDSALFANTLQVSDTSTDEGLRLHKALENRYVSNFQVEKISASYVSQHLEATLGDFYLSYGRGIVISLRKIDALGVDTTLRGGTVTARGAGFSANVAGGVTNIVNTDPSFGDVAPDPEDPILAAKLEYRLAQLFALSLEGAILWQNFTTANLAQYGPPCAPDGTPIGCTKASQLKQVPISPLGFGSINSQIIPSIAETGRMRTQNYGATLELPNLWNHGNAYVEYVHQLQDTANIQNQGDAVYAGVNAYAGNFTLQAEFKDYHDFRAPTFSSLPSTTFTAFHQQDVYNNPPNLEEIWQEEDLTNDIFGPRLRLDWQVSEHIKPYVAFLYFSDQDNGYDILTASGGLDANWQQHRSHLAFSGGYRYETLNAESQEPGQVHATEFWFQYDVIQVLTQQFALELDGLHRTHHDFGFSSNLLWQQGYAYVSLRQSKFSVSAGIEYYTQSLNEFQPWYPNVSGSYSINQNFLVRAFIGGREGGLRCINGVCRTYPGFNGTTVELVVKY